MDVIDVLELSSLVSCSPADYVFVTPVEVDSRGTYVSHDVSGASRRKRSLLSADAALHYRLSAFGRDMHLDLRLAKVVAEGFTVQTLAKEGITLAAPEPALHGCFYQGFIRNHISSSAAISTCRGLSGLIRMSDGEFLITPLPHHLAAQHNYSAPTGHHPHVLYKRSAEHRIHGEAVTMDTPNSANPLLRHHHHEQHGRQQRQHFCGRRRKYTPKPPSEDRLFMPDEPELQGRAKRSPIPSNKAGGLNVETLVVADQKMLEKHGRENVTTYILTVMNMVSSLFKDGTIGNDINIVVVSLLLLEDDPLGLSINHHADHSLNSFCQWQSGLIGRNGKRHDHAILLTGLDICSWKNEPCDTLGFAPISGMCNKYRSCTINEDTGLGLAFTIAHESGHNFGMVHDGEGNPCRRTEGNIMSPTLAGNNGVFSWSACSRQYLNRFLGTAQASCLVDEPRHIGKYKYPDQLPGQLYDADTQCKWQFGSKAKLYAKLRVIFVMQDICKSLWCHRAGQRCETKFMPAAEGTSCGHNMWCRRGQCVRFGDHGPRAVNGQWSEWSRWSDCSRSCGGGLMSRERFCNKPRPQYNGRFCPGLSRQHQMCNTKACPPNSMDFRAQQCAEYNSKPFRGWYYKWKPYTKVEDEDICKLYCIAEDFDFFFAMASKVKDGTSCSEVRPDVCVDGACEPVGCDQVLGSKLTLDACGVCKGDNSTCKFFKGRYLQQHRASAYYSLVTIPAGAWSIHVQMLEVSSSYLAVRSLKKKYYITGGWTADRPGKFRFAGTVFQYQRSFSRPESLRALGQTNETLVIELEAWGVGHVQSFLWRGPAGPHSTVPPQGVVPARGGSNTLAVPRRTPGSDPAMPDPGLSPTVELRSMVTYVWAGREEAQCVLQELGSGGRGGGAAGQHCSVSCGTGEQKREMRCAERDPRGGQDLQRSGGGLVHITMATVLSVLRGRGTDAYSSVSERGASCSGVSPPSEAVQLQGLQHPVLPCPTCCCQRGPDLHRFLQLVLPGSTAQPVQSQVLWAAVLQGLCRKALQLYGAEALGTEMDCGIFQSRDVAGLARHTLDVIAWRVSSSVKMAGSPEVCVMGHILRLCHDSLMYNRNGTAPEQSGVSAWPGGLALTHRFTPLPLPPQELRNLNTLQL
ncbi:hypothetical protein JZ751_020863, partial [Albula glossodonta]